jgi:hypothetical protein
MIHDYEILPILVRAPFILFVFRQGIEILPFRTEIVQK